MINGQYIPSEFDIGKIKHALTTGDVAEREYALKPIKRWKRPGSDHGFDDAQFREMEKFGCD